MISSKRAKRRRRRSVGLLLCAVAAACAAPEPAPRPRDVLLITIDTARADRFSYTGHPAPGTPHVDALAAQGAGFTNAISPVPLTLPAHASLMTGRQPPSHTVRDNGAYRLPEREITLAELLRDAGFETAAFIGAQVLDARYGLDQGFEHYDDEIPDPADATFLYYAERRGEEVVDAAVRWLDGRGPEPVFVWVHLFDPHTPYHPPEPERSLHASRYDGEIAYADRVVGRLLDHWQKSRAIEESLVVLTSDHGEGLGEHDEPTHGVLVHDSTLLVPLVIRAPGLRVDGPIADPVSLIDVLPTILGLLDLPAPATVQGRDLAPLLRGEELRWSSASGYAESLYATLHHDCAPLTALREDGWKLVRGTAEELYDLVSDPAESTDLASSEPERCAEMSSTLDDLAGGLATGEAEPLALDERSRRALEGLGYVWSRSTSRGGEGSTRDPREALRSMRQMADADRRALQGDLDGAAAGYRAVIEAEPAGVDARVRLAQIFASHGRLGEAVHLLAEAVALAPHEPVLHAKLGRALEQTGQFERSLAAYDAGLALHPGERDLRDGRWRCLNRLGRRDELLAEAERAIMLDPTDGMARFARAVGCCSVPLQDYVAALERELAELPGDPFLEAALAQARAEDR